MPLAGLVFVLHCVPWGPGPALGHALFVLVISGLGVEAFFYRFRKVPFACTHVPGKFKFHVWGIPIAFAVLVFFSAARAVERALLRKPSGFAVFLLVAASVWCLSWLGQRRFYRTASLVFEDEPAETMVTFPDGS